MMPIVNIADMTENDRALLTSYYRHWNIIPPSMECVGFKNDKPLFRTVEEDRSQ